MWDAKFAAAATKPSNSYVAVYHTISETFTFEREQELPRGTKTIEIPPWSKDIWIEHPADLEDDNESGEEGMSTADKGYHEVRKPRLVKLAPKVWAARNLSGNDDLFLLDD